MSSCPERLIEGAARQAGRALDTSIWIVEHTVPEGLVPQPIKDLVASGVRIVRESIDGVAKPTKHAAKLIDLQETSDATTTEIIDVLAEDVGDMDTIIVGMRQTLGRCADVLADSPPGSEKEERYKEAAASILEVVPSRVVLVQSLAPDQRAVIQERLDVPLIGSPSSHQPRQISL